MERKIVKPAYYDEFHCIAGDCDFTCCQEWKIAVDSKTLDRWKHVNPMYCKQTKGTKENKVIKLNKEGKCPFFNKQGLCSLVVEHGDEMISTTCQEFPREKHAFKERMEYTLMPCCPAVIDLLNQKDWEFQDNDILGPELLIRKFFMDLMNSRENSCEEALLMIFYFALDLNDNQKSECFDVRDLQKKLESYKSLTDKLLEAFQEMGEDKISHFAECNELFLDIIDNYRKEGLYKSYLNPLAALAENYEEQEIAYEDVGMEAFGQYNGLFHKILTQEIYADLILPSELEENAYDILEEILVRVQWTAMEYVFIRHMCYLHYMDRKSLTYNDVRTYIVLGSRMMGYEEADIYEYLENSFEELIWDFGYYSLIV